MSEGKYIYYSRNGHDYTETFGSDIYSSGSLTPYIHKSFLPSVKNVILDGEMCGYNVKENVLLSLSEDYDIKSNLREHQDLQTCYVVFDILYLNDQVLTNKPLSERLEYLKKAFNEIDGRIVYSQRETATTNQQVVDALNKAIDSRLEGIVVKNPNSVYKPSVRSNSGWYKVKPDYVLGLNDDLDLLILGGYYGEGKKRSGMISHFLLGVAVSDLKDSIKEKKSVNLNESDELDLEGNDYDDDKSQKKEEEKEKNHPTLFYSFCKIGSGYTMKELYDFNQKMANKWQPFDKKNPPKHLQVTYERPDVWIKPSESFIVQVKAVEVNPTEKYKAGFTLKFARLEKFRPDKSWFECMSLNEIVELREKNEGKLATGKHFNLDYCDEEGNFFGGDEDGRLGYEPAIKKKKMTPVSKAKSRTATVGSIYRGVDASCVDKKMDMFEEKEFCVMVEDDKMKKEKLEKAILELGGKITQNPGN
jgi:DNA ligase-4